MILSKSDYEEYVEADRVANGYRRKKPIVGYDFIWMYLITMRKMEYLLNVSNIPFTKYLLLYNKFKLRRYGVKLGISIPPNTFGKGLTIYHYGSLIVNESVKGGNFITIQSDVNISGNVTIGDNVYIAPGAKILENVEIAEGVIIGANAVVTKSINENYTTWAGIPAKKIKDKGYIDRG